MVSSLWGNLKYFRCFFGNETIWQLYICMLQDDGWNEGTHGMRKTIQHSLYFNFSIFVYLHTSWVLCIVHACIQSEINRYEHHSCFILINNISSHVREKLSNSVLWEANYCLGISKYDPGVAFLLYFKTEWLIQHTCI